MNQPATILVDAQQAQPVSEPDAQMPTLSCRIPSQSLVCLIGLQHSIMVRYLQMLAGLETPLAGTVTLLGQDTTQATAAQQLGLRRKAGFVLRGGPLLSVLNGLENLKLAARYHQLGDEQTIDARARELLQIMPHNFDKHLLPAYMTRLQRRLLAVARPLMLQPDILFIDSPFEGLDYQDKEYMAHYLSTISLKYSLSLVVASDDLQFAQRFADQVIFCDEDDALFFNDWESFYRCSHKIITLLLEYQNINKDARP